jgi:nucleoside-diphosphate-sugar epimerase
MTILISGATGFVGSAITRHLLVAGFAVRAMSRSTTRAISKLGADEAGRRALADGRLTFVEADVTDPGSLAAAVDAVDTVIQAAQFKGAPVEDPARGLTYEAVDRNGTLNLLDAARPGRTRFLYMSGISVGPGATKPWDRAKWQAEVAIRASGLEWTIVRGCWAYGPGDEALNRIIGYSDYLPFVPIFGAGDEPLSPLFVDDIGRFFTLLMRHPAQCRDTVFGLGGPDTVTLVQFLETALQTMGRRRPILRIPKPVGRLQGAVMQHLPGRPLTPDAVDFVSQAGALSTDDRRLLAERLPEFRATSIKDGLRSYLAPRSRP